MEILKGAHNQNDTPEGSLPDEIDFVFKENFHDAGPTNLAVRDGVKKGMTTTPSNEEEDGGRVRKLLDISKGTLFDDGSGIKRAIQFLQLNQILLGERPLLSPRKSREV
ncbi:hypothetical protein V6N12_021021 [Hibiscus sabdariffa]|uniref:Uncharacterized protein n=1 Tax=Hibiscus sabdariffa TaxID=183260 RepID=A0ABR2B250_9ROSI